MKHWLFKAEVTVKHANVIFRNGPKEELFAKCRQICSSIWRRSSCDHRTHYAKWI